MKICYQLKYKNGLGTHFCFLVTYNMFLMIYSTIHPLYRFFLTIHRSIRSDPSSAL
nr:CPPV084 V-type Ig domain protein [Cooks petrelpox virus]